MPGSGVPSSLAAREPDPSCTVVIAEVCAGAHDTTKLKESLEKFIKTYVQCYSCGNPETMVKVKKDFISLKCKACGEVSDVDMRHKLNTFILKNPPEDKTSKAEKKCAAFVGARSSRRLCCLLCMQFTKSSHWSAQPCAEERAGCCCLCSWITCASCASLGPTRYSSSCWLQAEEGREGEDAGDGCGS